MADAGYIKLYRQMKNWEWYQNSNVKSVFIHCLLKANFTPGKFEGVDIPVGSFVSSYNNLGIELGMSRSTVYDCISKLEKSGEVGRTPNGKFTVFTLFNYDKFQEPEQTSDRNRTRSERKPNQYKNDKKYKEIKNISAPAEEIDTLKNRTF